MSGGFLARGVFVQGVFVRGFMSGGFLSGGFLSWNQPLELHSRVCLHFCNLYFYEVAMYTMKIDMETLYYLLKKSNLF